LAANASKDIEDADTPTKKGKATASSRYRESIKLMVKQSKMLLAPERSLLSSSSRARPTLRSWRLRRRLVPVMIAFPVRRPKQETFDGLPDSGFV